MFHAVKWSSSCCAEAGAVRGVLDIAGVFQLVLGVSAGVGCFSWCWVFPFMPWS